MKKINIILFFILLMLQSCTAGFIEMNTNPNQVTGEQMEVNNYRTGTKILNLQNLVIPVQEHMYQFNESLSGGPFAGYIGSTVDTWLTRFETFNPSDDWRKWPFANVMTDSYAPYRGIVNQTDDEVANAFANLLRVAIMHRMTDSYGPIPYSNAVANESVFVKYDSQRKVYETMFNEIDEAIAVLTANSSIAASAWNKYDYVYYGNISQWVKYANSLKLRMAMRLSYVNPQLAKSKAAEAIAAGVITSNADNAQMHAPENRTALIYNDWSDHRVGADIINYMNGYEDPRREKMFTSVPAGPGSKEMTYSGVRVGGDVSSKTEYITYYSNMIVSTTSPYLWMNAAEVSFLMAEYELRWGSVDTAKSLYDNGIRLSFEERGAEGAEAYIMNSDRKPAPYADPLGHYSVTAAQSEITIAWEESTNLADGTVPADDASERNLERIITQKWISSFPLGVEGWSEYRRTGYPRLLPAPQDKSGGSVDLDHHARRLTYPVEEYRMNAANLQEAVNTLNSEATGERKGDIMGTRVWWDVKQYN